MCFVAIQHISHTFYGKLPEKYARSEITSNLRVGEIVVSIHKEIDMMTVISG